jgi:hypothetical protein
VTQKAHGADERGERDLSTELEAMIGSDLVAGSFVFEFLHVSRFAPARND